VAAAFVNKLDPEVKVAAEFETEAGEKESTEEKQAGQQEENLLSQVVAEETDEGVDRSTHKVVSEEITAREKDTDRSSDLHEGDIRNETIQKEDEEKDKEQAGATDEIDLAVAAAFVNKLDPEVKVAAEFETEAGEKESTEEKQAGQQEDNLLSQVVAEETDDADPTTFVATTDGGSSAPEMLFAVGYADADGNLVTLEERKLAHDGRDVAESEIASVYFAADVAPSMSVPDENTAMLMCSDEEAEEKQEQDRERELSEMEEEEVQEHVVEEENRINKEVQESYQLEQEAETIEEETLQVEEHSKNVNSFEEQEVKEQQNLDVENQLEEEVQQKVEEHLKVEQQLEEDQQPYTDNQLEENQLTKEQVEHEKQGGEVEQEQGEQHVEVEQQPEVENQRKIEEQVEEEQHLEIQEKAENELLEEDQPLEIEDQPEKEDTLEVDTQLEEEQLEAEEEQSEVGEQLEETHQLEVNGASEVEELEEEQVEAEEKQLEVREQPEETPQLEANDASEVEQQPEEEHLEFEQVEEEKQPEVKEYDAVEDQVDVEERRIEVENSSDIEEHVEELFQEISEKATTDAAEGGEDGDDDDGTPCDAAEASDTTDEETGDEAVESEKLIGGSERRVVSEVGCDPSSDVGENSAGEEGGQPVDKDKEGADIAFVNADNDHDVGSEDVASEAPEEGTEGVTGCSKEIIHEVECRGANLDGLDETHSSEKEILDENLLDPARAADDSAVVPIDADGNTSEGGTDEMIASLLKEYMEDHPEESEGGTADEEDGITSTVDVKLMGSGDVEVDGYDSENTLEKGGIVGDDNPVVNAASAKKLKKRGKPKKNVDASVAEDVAQDEDEHMSEEEGKAPNSKIGDNEQKGQVSSTGAVPGLKARMPGRQASVVAAPGGMDTKKVPTVEKEHIAIPPNALYRFLLSKGAVGHVVATILVLIVELIERYCPQVSTLILYVLAKFGIDLSDEAKLRLIEKQIKKNKNEGGINPKYKGFVGSNVEKHENKEIKKRRDENAAEKLKDLNYLSSKYKYLSEAFMKRHNLGEFADTSSDQSNGSKSSKLSKKMDCEEKEDEDVDWIVEALANPPSADKNQETSVTDSSKAASSSLDIGFSFSSSKLGSKYPRPRTSPVLSSDDLKKLSTSASMTKGGRPATQRTSDRDGGGGIFGRIRAAGVGSTFSSKLFGAYPGDAPSLEEAGSAEGVVALARKYGYHGSGYSRPAARRASSIVDVDGQRSPKAFGGAGRSRRKKSHTGIKSTRKEDIGRHSTIASQRASTVEGSIQNASERRKEREKYD